MSSELITPDNISKELLQSLFDAAYMETSYDADGDLRVKDKIGCWVQISKTNDRVSLLSIFGFTKTSSRLERLEAVNKLNSDFLIIKAMVGQNDQLRMEYDILIGEGITGKDIVLATRKFLGIPLPAIAQDAASIVT